MQNLPFQPVADAAPPRGAGTRAVGRLLRPKTGLEARRSPLASIELLRLVSALGIVWFHLQAPGARIAYSALPLFLILSAYFTIGTATRDDWPHFWAGRLQRIALPWIAWSAFYLALDGYRYGGLSPDNRAVEPFFLIVLIGGSLHLWFLPFLLLVSGPVRLAAQWVRSSGAVLWLTLGALPVALFALYVHTRVLLPAPFAQWSMALPAVCYGVIAALGRRWDLRIASALFLAVLAVASLGTGSSDGLLQLTLAAAAFELFLRLDIGAGLPGGLDLMALGRLSFGIYLVHPFCILIYFKLFSGTGRSLRAALAIFVMSACFTAILQRLPGLRRLV